MHRRYAALSPMLISIAVPLSFCQCSNSCGYSLDGDCDDGGNGAEYSSCSLGQDCYDCGSRSAPSGPTGSGTTGTIVDGSVTWTTGGGSSSPWSVTSMSSLVSYCAQYDLCTSWYAFDGTSSNPTGKSIDFAGPNYGGGPWQFTIDMGANFQYTHWRVAGHTHYSFGAVELRYQNSASVMVTVPGSAFVWDSSVGGLQSAAFTSPISAQVWQVYITTHTNSDNQARFQLYLTEVQFGSGVVLRPPPPPPPPPPPLPRHRPRPPRLHLPQAHLHPYHPRPRHPRHPPRHPPHHRPRHLHPHHLHHRPRRRRPRRHPLLHRPRCPLRPTSLHSPTFTLRRAVVRVPFRHVAS